MTTGFAGRSFRLVISSITILVVLLALVPAAPAQADGPKPVLDQSFMTPSNASIDINLGYRWIAQTFTAGLTGALTHVSLDILPISGRALKVSIRGVTNGLPNGMLYSENFVFAGPAQPPLSYAPPDLMISVGPVYVQAGHQYAIVVEYDGSGAPGTAEGTWLGATGDYYGVGGAFGSNDVTFANWAELGPAPLDLHFTTYVVPGVPVSDLSVVFDGGAKRAKACQTFEEHFTIRNDGPDPADHVYLGMNVTDQFDVLSITSADGSQTAPFHLDAGQSLSLKVLVKVTAFVPGESRDGWYNAHVSMDAWPDITIDPNESNDYYNGNVRLISRPRDGCPG